MILPMSVVAPCSCVGVRVSGIGVDGSVVGRHGHEGRADDAVAEAVAAPDLLDDLALGPAGAGHVGDGLVLARVERPAGRGVDGGHALALEQQAELAVDGGDALEPGVLGDRRRVAPRWRGRSRRRRPRTLRIRSSPASPRSRSRSSAVRRLKFRNSARSRWSAARYSSARAERVVALGGQRLDLGGEGGRRDVDLVGALLGAGAVSVRHRGDPPARS